MKYLFTYIFLFIIAATKMVACTTVVIPGSSTLDGKPMIYKVRDTGFLTNKMVSFEGDRYRFLGLVNSEESDNKQVWGGSNEKGFAIMNSASFNVNLEDTTSFKDQEGFFMKKALGCCASLADFEALLQSTPHPMGLASHFGVIDAKGGAAFYEVNNNGFTKFDANDRSVAPMGYLLRTNFSYTGKKNVGYGFCRYQTAERLLMDDYLTNRFTPQRFMQCYSRCFKHELLKCDYREMYEELPASRNQFITTSDLITRYDTSSAILIQGVTVQQPSSMNTIWVQVGFPETSITLPLWMGEESVRLPYFLEASDDYQGNSPLNAWAMKWKEECFPLETIEKERYLNVSKLFNSEHMGYLQQIEEAETRLFEVVEMHQKKWGDSLPSSDDIEKVYDEYIDIVESLYCF